MLNRTMRSIPWCLVLFYFVTFQSGSVADGPLDGARKLIVREFCAFSGREQYRQNGSLSFDGKDLIVVVPGKKLSLFDVKDLKERVISENPLIDNAWSDSATGCVFVVMKSEKIGSKDEGKRHLEFFDLLCFDNTNDLVNWKPNWARKRLPRNKEKEGKDLQIQWIPGVQQFALFRTSAINDFSFLDMKGNDVGKITLPGPVFGGFDTSDEGIEVYFVSNDRPTGFVTRGILNAKQEKLLRSNRLYPSPFRTPFTHCDVTGREMRLRGLKQGDVRRFVELGNQSEHYQHKDHENIGLEPSHLESLKIASRSGNARINELGRLSYSESPTNFEVVQGSASRLIPTAAVRLPPFVFRRSGELTLLPLSRGENCWFVVDAVLTDETWVVSMFADTSDGTKNGSKTTFAVCTLDGHARQE